MSITWRRNLYLLLLFYFFARSFFNGDIKAQCGKKGVDMEIDICINISDFFRTKVVWNIIRDDLAPFFPKSTFSKFRHVAILATFGGYFGDFLKKDASWHFEIRHISLLDMFESVSSWKITWKHFSRWSIAKLRTRDVKVGQICYINLDLEPLTFSIHDIQTDHVGSRVVQKAYYLTVPKK